MAEPCHLDVVLGGRNPAVEGDMVPVRAYIRSFAQVPTNPTTVRLRYRRPDFTAGLLTYGTDVALTRPATGEYRADIDLTQPGVWIFRWEADGNVKGAAEVHLAVAESDVV